MTIRQSIPRMLAAIAAVSLLLLGLVAGTARADDIADSYVVEGSVAADGKLSMKETITFPKGATPAKLTQRLANREDGVNMSQYVFEIQDVKVTAGGTDLGASVKDDDGYTVIEVDTAQANDQPIVISYSVKGAVRSVPKVANSEERSLVNWRVLQGLSVAVKKVSGVVSSPGQISYIDCKSGAPDAPGACTLWQGGTHESPQPSFEDGPRGVGEIVALSFNVPATAVKSNEKIDYKWTLDRAFSFTPTSIALSLGTLLLGAALLYGLHRASGRDVAAQSSPTRIAEFAPVGEGESEFKLLEDVRPGHIGTVADERVDPVDVTGTLIDLAVRGHIRIHELERTGAHQPLNWSFERLQGGRGELRPYEVVLRDAVAPETGEVVTVDGISAAVTNVIPEVQDKLYDDVVEYGWFDKRPDNARNNWAIIGWVALTTAILVTALLVAFTRLGLWGLALILIALGIVLVAERMPRRSARGSELLAGLQALSNDLLHQRTDQMPKGREYHELSELLPYAVVLGGRERWLQALADADDDEGVADPTDLDWYHAPETWHLSDLPAAVKAFVTTVQGHLFGR